MITKNELNQILDRFIAEEVALDQEDISAAASSKDWLLKRIQNKIIEKSSGPQLYSDPFVGYGSYFARLKVSDPDEMDFLVVIDSNTGEFKQDNQVFGKGKGSASPNHKYDSQFKKADGTGVSPNKLLTWLADIVWEVIQPLGGTKPVINGPAVEVRLVGKGIKFDLVPCGVFDRTDGSERMFYNIPKGDAADGWTLTNPREDIERIDRLAEKRNNFRNVIRLLKVIRDSYSLPISSYAVQCAVCDFAEKNTWYNDFFTDFSASLGWLEKLVRAGFIADGFQPSVNLLAGANNLAGTASTMNAVGLGLTSLILSKDAEAAYKKLTRLLKAQREDASQSQAAKLLKDLEALMGTQRTGSSGTPSRMQ